MSNILKYYKDFKSEQYKKRDGSPFLKAVAACLFCNKSYTDSNNTSNFLAHIQKHHKDNLDVKDMQLKK